MISEVLEIVELGLAEGLIEMNAPEDTEEAVEKFLSGSASYVEFSEE